MVMIETTREEALVSENLGVHEAPAREAGTARAVVRGAGLPVCGALSIEVSNEADGPTARTVLIYDEQETCIGAGTACRPPALGGDGSDPA